MGQPGLQIANVACFPSIATGARARWPFVAYPETCAGSALHWCQPVQRFQGPAPGSAGPPVCPAVTPPDLCHPPGHVHTPKNGCDSKLWSSCKPGCARPKSEAGRLVQWSDLAVLKALSWMLFAGGWQLAARPGLHQSHRKRGLGRCRPALLDGCAEQEPEPAHPAPGPYAQLRRGDVRLPHRSGIWCTRAAAHPLFLFTVQSGAVAVAHQIHDCR